MLLGLTLAVPIAPAPAEAAPTPRAATTTQAASPARPAARQDNAGQANARKPQAAPKLVAGAAAPRRAAAQQASLRRAPAYSGPVLQCVVFARNVSGIHLSGNAHTWWHSAAGQFARGHRPEAGAVLNFRASGGMRLGHVSVVSRVVSARELLVDDANWAGPGQRKGQVRRGASVIDVSPNNDWSEVRVANGIGSWGRVYPTYGFIYPRADRTRDADRIELAAERPLPVARVLAPAPAAAPAAAPATAATRWVWTNGVATQVPVTSSRGLAGVLDAAAEPRPAPRADAAAPTRWTWVNGQAVSAR